MNFLDIILICVAGLFLIRGFFRGLVREILSLTAVILGVVLASRYNSILAPHLELYISNQMTVAALSYVLVFVGTVLAFWLLAKGIQTILNIALLGWLDRLMGGILGLAEGALVSMIVLMLVQSFAPDSETVKTSLVAQHSRHVMEVLGDMTPESMRDALKSKGIDLPSPQEAINGAKTAIGMDSPATGDEE